jgi:hypothetical protein
MKYFLVVVLCMNGLCENFLTTEPEFTSREECRQFSEIAVEKIRKNLPESSGSTYCFDEKEIIDLTNSLLKQEQELLEQFNQEI